MSESDERVMIKIMQIIDLFGNDLRQRSKARLVELDGWTERQAIGGALDDGSFGLGGEVIL